VISISHSSAVLSRTSQTRNTLKSKKGGHLSVL
jgi:hypothetical protein